MSPIARRIISTRSLSDAAGEFSLSGDCAAGIKRTRFSRNCSLAFLAIDKCPSWMGSKLPPNSPIRRVWSGKLIYERRKHSLQPSQGTSPSSGDLLTKIFPRSEIRERIGAIINNRKNKQIGKSSRAANGGAIKRAATNIKG